MTEDKDRGYFIEAWVCQDGLYKWWTVSFPDQYTTTYTVRDEQGCAYPSSVITSYSIHYTKLYENALITNRHCYNA